MGERVGKRGILSSLKTLVIAAVACVVLFVFEAPAWAACHVGSFVGTPYKVAEGEGSVTITYSNGSGSQPGGSVDYRTVDGTARAGKDYTATSGTLTWGSLPVAAMRVSGVNPAYRSFTVPILQDAIDEATESFTIEMSNFTGCFDAGLSDRTAQITISDDDVTTVKTRSTTGPPEPETSTHPSARPTEQASTSKRTPEQTSSPAPRPTDTRTFLTVAEPGGGGGGLSRGGVVAIAVGVVAAGVAAAVWIRHRLFT